MGFQGARILGRRIWNGISGKDNKSVEEDLQEFVQSSLKSAATSGLTVAITGAVTVAVKSGWLGNVLKNTPAGRIANAICIGIENTKILYKFAKGEITGAEALDQAGSATCSLVGAKWPKKAAAQTVARRQAFPNKNCQGEEKVTKIIKTRCKNGVQSVFLIVLTVAS